MVITVTLNTSVDKTVEVAGLRVGATLAGRVIRRQPAGKGVNVARFLTQLGQRCAVAGLVGAAERQLFADELTRLGIDDRLVAVADRTRENVTYLDPAAHSVTHIREPGFAVAPAELAELRDVLSRLVGHGDWLVISGSLPPALAVSTIGELVQLGRERGALVAVDSSGPSLARALAARPYLVKPNRDELAELTGTPVPTVAAAASVARRLLAEVVVVVTSLESEGAVAVAAGEAWHGRVMVDRVGNTVGCGDALLAGFISARASGADLAACLKRAVAAGSARACCPVDGELAAATAALEPRVELHRIAATL